MKYQYFHKITLPQRFFEQRNFSQNFEKLFIDSDSTTPKTFDQTYAIARVSPNNASLGLC